MGPNMIQQMLARFDLNYWYWNLKWSGFTFKVMQAKAILKLQKLNNATFRLSVRLIF